ncbi:MAG: hypothetical protein KF760_12870 [Candidatus Eremiobacteraeota bacterium]|nr:hypothetical protein [Candidatus Eremiobacteraeota bacterium]MCW5871778.1 hypothetical protein [Candidatus Eremiobacteraeota bacterium]
MNIGNINSVRGPEEIGSIRSTPVLRPAPLLGSAPLPNDSVRVNGSAPVQETGGKPLSQVRDEFKVGLAGLKNQSDDDKSAIRDIARMVDERTDLNSREKEWLFATEMGAYTADAAMSMTSLEKKGQPWTAKQQSRFEALTQTYAAAKGVAEAVTPMVARPDSAPSFEAAGPGAPIKAAAPLTPAPLQPAPPIGVPTAAASATPAADGNAQAGNTPPAPPKDPLVAIWESRRQEAQDVFNDYKALMQKMTEWKQRIIASRIAFFWKVYGAHTTFLSDGWKR